MDDICRVCAKKTTKIEFKLQDSVSSDAKFIHHAISHSYCNYCAYVFTDNENRIDYNEFYTKSYDFLLDGDVEPTIGEIKYSEYLVDFYSEFINKNDVKSFFDIGGGKGNFVSAVYDKFPQLKYSALEPSKSYEVLKQKSFISELYNNFFYSENFNKKYDYLSLIGVLEHVPNPKEFLLDIKNIMNKDSYLLIEVPNFKNNKADLLTIDHLSKFTEESITNLFNVTGFVIQKQQVLSTVPMQYIIKIGNIKDIVKGHITIDINNAVAYLNKSFNDAKEIRDNNISLYGQGLVMEYLLGVGILSSENISCIIDDNPLYQGKKWKNKISIIDFKTFEKKYKTKNIFLSMNDCYHEKILSKLNNYDIYGMIK
jgi:2-polyprenyl-3-methyl-5-hydroxy-6-metoxy-1,4-benzoquinol methylase